MGLNCYSNDALTNVVLDKIHLVVGFSPNFDKSNYFIHVLPKKRFFPLIRYLLPWSVVPWAKGIVVLFFSFYGADAEKWKTLDRERFG
jgi:hypothetical protein